MSPRIKLLARVQQTRKRLRDAAATDLLLAEQAADQAIARERDAHDRLNDVLDQAYAALREATSVAPLVALEESRKAASWQIVSAQKARWVAERLRSEQRTVLSEREYELRRIEKLLQREQDRFRACEARHEQKANDDRAGARTRRHS